MQQIKKLFLTYRNGIIADTLRKNGWPHKVIFGLNLPQITEIAHTLPSPDEKLATQLWHDRDVRESRLLATFLMPNDMQKKDVEIICSDIRTREEADLLAFRWLRYHKEAHILAKEFSNANHPLLSYLSTAIKRFL